MKLVSSCRCLTTIAATRERAWRTFRSEWNAAAGLDVRRAGYPVARSALNDLTWVRAAPARAPDEHAVRKPMAASAAGVRGDRLDPVPSGRGSAAGPFVAGCGAATEVVAAPAVGDQGTRKWNGWSLAAPLTPVQTMKSLASTLSLLRPT